MVKNLSQCIKWKFIRPQTSLSLGVASCSAHFEAHFDVVGVVSGAQLLQHAAFGWFAASVQPGPPWVSDKPCSGAGGGKRGAARPLLPALSVGVGTDLFNVRIVFECIMLRFTRRDKNGRLRGSSAREIRLPLQAATAGSPLRFVCRKGVFWGPLSAVVAAVTAVQH